jgi:hypothetical protein
VSFALSGFGIAEDFKLADHHAYRQDKGMHRTEEQKAVLQFFARQKKDQTDENEPLDMHR